MDLQLNAIENLKKGGQSDADNTLVNITPDTNTIEKK